MSSYPYLFRLEGCKERTKRKCVWCLTSVCIGRRTTEDTVRVRTHTQRQGDDSQGERNRVVNGMEESLGRRDTFGGALMSTDLWETCFVRLLSMYVEGDVRPKQGDTLGPGGVSLKESRSVTRSGTHVCKLFNDRIDDPYVAHRMN